MRAQSSVISLVMIAGIIIALVGAAYVWAVPLIEKRMTVTDYDLVERFMLDLDSKIVSIANSGSGTERLEIPRGKMTLFPYNYAGAPNNTISLDFTVSQPLITEGAMIPIKTTSLDAVGEYGKTESRIITLSRVPGTNDINLNMNMTYRELRSISPRGYIITLCPVTGFEACQNTISGSNYITVSYGGTEVVPREVVDGGPLTLTRIKVEVT